MFSSLLPLAPDVSATGAPFLVADEAEMLALPALVGDFAIRADSSSSWQLRYAPATVLTNWQEFPGGPPGGSSINWLGAWSNATTYAADDAVSYQGSSYLCILGHTNQSPPNITYWGILAQKGDTGAAGVDGVDGNDGAAGADGADGNTVLYGTVDPTTEGVNGNFYINTSTNFIFGPKAAGVWPAGTSLIGPAGSAGTDGADGNDGADGAAGADGLRGGVRYNFSTTTTDADPGTGIVRANNGTVGSVTFLYFDNTDTGSADLTGWLDSFDDSNASTNRGTITIQSAAISGTTALVFRVAGAVVDGSGYRKVPVTYLSGALPADAEALAINFAPAGPPPILTTSVKSGTSYTLVLADAGTMVQFSNTGAISLEVPTNASVAFPIGTQILIQQTGASPGQTTVSGAGGVTVNVRGSRTKTAGQWAIGTLIKTDTNTWQLGGDMGT